MTVVPSIDHPTFRFISGTFGPMQSGMPCELPLWLALDLRKRNKCSIKVPNWLSVAHLETCVAAERNQVVLGTLHYHYIEIAHLLLNHANEDINHAEHVSSLLQDLENIRMDRIRLGVGSTAETVNKDASILSTALNNVSAMEITMIRGFFLHSMNAFMWLKPPEGEDGITTTGTAAARSAGNRMTGVNQDGDVVVPASKKLRRFRNN